MSFTELQLHPSLLANITALGYQEPTPIQAQAIPVVLEGRDLLGIAKTGSGKTASFILPVLNKLIAIKNNERSRQPKVLILLPTRELAVQVADVCQELGRNLPRKIQSMAVYGGVSINPQMKNMYGVEILIATPGRLLDLYESSAVDLSKVEQLVIDEADKLLNLGFYEEMQEIFDLLPRKRQNLLFSATLSHQLEGINRVLLSKPAIVSIEQKIEESTELINLSSYLVTDERKGPLLRYLIEEQDMQQVLVFTSSGNKADKVAAKLNKNGIQALSIHGKKSQGARTSALKKFKAGDLQVLVATDLISRGIDIYELPYVINYELPRSPKDFVHRVGRTGRASSEGIAITLVTSEDMHHFKVILKKMKRYVDMVDSEELDF